MEEAVVAETDGAILDHDAATAVIDEAVGGLD
jgi:hypothetical protein